ncbi:ferric/cupric-chelate reductase [Lobulomyces angularis]|nr:ferric/cupric-chelate reductase [Lobulomyces angularis]
MNSDVILNKVKLSSGSIIDKHDLVFIGFYFIPFGFLISISHILTPLNNDTSALSTVFNRQIPSKLFGVNTIGKLVFIILILITNGMWWFTPIISTGFRSTTPSILVFEKIAQRSAIPAMWDMALSFIFYCRENKFFVHLLRKVKGENNCFETGLNYHKLFGALSFALLSFHALGYFVYYFIEEAMITGLLPNNRRGLLNFFGIIAWASMILMILTSIYLIRRKCFKLFYWVHQLYIVVIIFGVIHYWKVIYYVMPALLYFIYDKYNSKFTSLEFKNAMAKIYTLDGSIIRLDISLPGNRDFPMYEPGSWVNVCVPQISKVNWHPFSITSTFAENKSLLTIHVAVKGKWSTSLSNLTNFNDVSYIPVQLHGYFGGEMEESNTANAANNISKKLLIAGGTGISALIPTFKKFAQSEDLNGFKFVWILKKPTDLLIYTEFILELEKLSRKSNFKWRPVIFCTRANNDMPKLLLDNGFHKETKLIINSSISTHQQLTNNHNNEKNAKSAVLSFIIFTFGIIGFMLGRLVQLSTSDFMHCKMTYAVDYYHHFMCYYWYSFGPLAISVAFATLAGNITISKFTTIFKKGKEEMSESTQRVAKLEEITRESSLVSFLTKNIQHFKPNLNDIITESFPTFNENEIRNKIKVYTAGSNGFNNDIIDICKNNSYQVFVETWEI